MSQSDALTLHDKADMTNDSHDHDELHAAAVVSDMLDGKRMGELSDREYNYLYRWVEGLL